MKHTPEQKKAIQCIDKDLVVTAGAGTGKTRVLVDRIIYIIKNAHAKIDEIVAITYTNKAAVEIIERLRHEMKKQNNKNLAKSIEKLQIAYIGTIHSFCFRLLQENPVLADLDPGVGVIEEYRAKALLKESVEKAILIALDDDRVYMLTEKMGFEKIKKEIFYLLEKMLNQGYLIGKLQQKIESDKEEVIVYLLKQALKFYSDKKNNLNVIDYEDILQKTLALLRNNPDVLKYYHNKFKYIMIDEYQDLNFVQDEILRLLGSGSNFFVVGDKKQSIYGFRGSQVKLFEKLCEDLKQKGQNIVLKDNFRSSANIIDFVNDKFEDIINDYEQLDAFRPHKDFPSVEVLLSNGKGLIDERKQQEATLIARKIKIMIQDDNIRIYDKENKDFRKPLFKDFCILLRNRTHLHYYTRALKEENIPFYAAASEGLTSSKAVTRLLNALKALQFQDEISLYGTLVDLLKVDSLDVLNFILSNGRLLLPKNYCEITNLTSEIKWALQRIYHWLNIKHKNSIYKLIDKILCDTDLISEAIKDDNFQELENLLRLKDIAQDYDSQGYTLEEFLKEIEDFGENQEEVPIVDEEDNVVKFITIHSSKGLEFPIVILADAANNISLRSSEILFEPETGIALKTDKEKWSSIKQLAEEKEIEEAKRLLYVALTRAKDYLIISGEEKLGKRPSFLKWILQKGKDCKSFEITRELKDVTILTETETKDVRSRKLPTCPKISDVKGKGVFSVTAIAKFLQCPRKYYLSNILQIPEKAFYENISNNCGLSPAVRGSIVHELIEKSDLYKIRPDRLMKSLNETDLSIEDREFIKLCLENFSKSNVGEVEGIYYSEIPFIWSPNPNYAITGKIDRLVLRDNEAEIIDFKTSSKIYEDIYNVFEIQGMLYLLAVERILKVKVKRIIIASLYEGKDYEINVSQQNKTEFSTKLLSHIDRMTKKDIKNYDKDKAEHCIYCGYKGKICK